MPGSSLRRPCRVLSIVVGTALLGFAATPMHALADNTPLVSPSDLPTLGPVTAASPSPSETPESGGRHHRHHHDTSANSSPVPSASASPPSISFTSFTGTWEVALQSGSKTIYSHFWFDPTSGTTLSGQWLEKKTLTPISGEIDGDRFRFAGTNAQGPFSLTGYEENSAAMVGVLLQGTNRVPFTATHQGGPKLKNAQKKNHHHKHGSTSTGSNG